jgi:hypothetical protein
VGPNSLPVSSVLLYYFLSFTCGGRLLFLGLQLPHGDSLMVKWELSCLLYTSSFLERLSLILVDVIFTSMPLVDVFISHIAPQVSVNPCQVTLSRIETISRPFSLDKSYGHLRRMSS